MSLANGYIVMGNSGCYLQCLQIERWSVNYHHLGFEKTYIFSNASRSLSAIWSSNRSAETVPLRLVQVNSAHIYVDLLVRTRERVNLFCGVEVTPLFCIVFSLHTTVSQKVYTFNYIEVYKQDYYAK